jgi:hypothetical protein
LVAQSFNQPFRAVRRTGGSCRLLTFKAAFQAQDASRTEQQNRALIGGAAASIVASPKSRATVADLVAFVIESSLQIDRADTSGRKDRPRIRAACLRGL